MRTNNRYYVYYHINPLNNQVFYVGKGVGSRLYEWNRGRNKKHYIVQEQIKNAGLKPKALIVETFEREMDAYRAEKQHIKNLRLQGEPLTNMVDGGLALCGQANPMFGRKRMDVTIRNKAKKGKNWEELYGKEKSDEMKTRISRKGEENPMFGKHRGFSY